jgi:hypothetical protein
VQKLPHARTTQDAEKQIPFDGSIHEQVEQRKHKGKCVFCNADANIEIDDEDITLCMHCIRVLQTKQEAIRRFL